MDKEKTCGRCINGVDIECPYCHTEFTYCTEFVRAIPSNKIIKCVFWTDK